MWSGFKQVIVIFIACLKSLHIVQKWQSEIRIFIGEGYIPIVIGDGYRYFKILRPYYLKFKESIMSIRKIFILFAALGLIVSASAATNRSATKQIKNLVQSQSVSAKININTADASALEAINGIGPKKAESIVTYRKQKGRFASLEDLTKVKGVGAKRLEKIQQYLTV